MMYILVVMVVNSNDNDLGNTYSILIIYCVEKEIVKTL